MLVERESSACLAQWLRMLADPMALMLAGASALYMLLGKPHEAAVLAAVIVPVLGVDVLMEARSRSALKKLASAVAPRSRVLRNRQPVEIPTAELVPGDLLLFREGDILRADGIVRRAANLTLDESQLTGEAEPQDKIACTGPSGSEAGEKCRFFAGSMVLAGHGMGEITATGPRTRFGNIARLVGEAELQATPLQMKTARVARWLIGIALGLAAAIFAVRWSSGAPPNEALLYAVSLAMSAVCEEVVLVLSLFLTLAALRLSRTGVLVKRLASVETLGSTTVICMDKTGTLTAGKIRARGPSLSGCRTPRRACPAGSRGAGLRARRDGLAGARNTGALPKSRCRCGSAAAKLAARVRLLLRHGRQAHVPCLDARTRRQRGNGGAASTRIVAKSALEGILEHCTLKPGDRERAYALNSELADQGMRVLAVAGRFTTTGDPAHVGAGFCGALEQDERDLVL